LVYYYSGGKYDTGKLLNGATLDKAKNYAKERQDFHINNSELNLLPRAVLAENRDRMAIYANYNQPLLS